MGGCLVWFYLFEYLLFVPWCCFAICCVCCFILFGCLVPVACCFFGILIMLFFVFCLFVLLCDLSGLCCGCALFVLSLSVLRVFVGFVDCL